MYISMFQGQMVPLEH